MCVVLCTVKVKLSECLCAKNNYDKKKEKIIN